MWIISILAQATSTMIFHTYFPRPLSNLPFHYPRTDNLLIKTWHRDRNGSIRKPGTVLGLRSCSWSRSTPGAKPQELLFINGYMVWEAGTLLKFGCYLSYLSLNTPDIQQLDATHGPSNNAEEKSTGYNPQRCQEATQSHPQLAAALVSI